MPIKSLYCKIFELYEGGMSGKEVASYLGFKHSNSVRQILKKFGKLRTQSAASSLAVNQGKKEKSLSLLIVAAKTTNRFNPKKSPGKKELHPNWIKDRSKLKNKRSITEERYFFKEIIIERGVICELSGIQNSLSVHHIRGVWKYPELMYSKENCIVIHKKIHKLFHNIYGNRTDKNDWDEFVLNKEYTNLFIGYKKRNYVPFEDKTGKRFGRLLVICKNNRTWKCKCDCGNETYVDSGSLNSGHTISCGCYMKECNRERLTKSKIWELSPTVKKGYKYNEKQLISIRQKRYAV